MITITKNFVINGKYSAYIPLEIQATHSNNVEYLDFQLINGFLNFPKIRAYRLANGRYKVDFSAQAKSLFPIREADGLSLNQLEVFNILLLEVEITDPIDGSTPVQSNPFFAYPFLDTTFIDDETAKHGFNRKFLLSEDPKVGGGAFGFDRNYNKGCLNGYSRLFTFNQTIFVDTLLNGVIRQSFEFDFSGIKDEQDIISIPVSANMLSFDGTDVKLWNTVNALNPSLILRFNGIRLRFGDAQRTQVDFLPCNDCNLNEFIYVNRYGAKDNYFFKSYENKSLATTSDEFERFSPLTNNGANFVFGSQSQKINQNHSQEFLIDEGFVPYANRDQLIDFVKSPIHWINQNGNLVQVVVFDAKYDIVSKSRGVKFSFRYKLAQKELAFI